MPLLRTLYTKLSPLDRSLILASGACVALLILRFLYTQNLVYSFLVWNLFLAALPLAFARCAPRLRGPAQYGMLAVWLLFFPNAPYILTDLIHLSTKSPPQLIWFDALLIAAFAGTGLVLGLESLRCIHEHIMSRFGARIAALSVVAIAFLSGFGIYIGRFLRWNSWDVVARPFGLMADVLHRFLFPFEHPRTWAFTLFFGAFILVTYLMFMGIRKGTSSDAFPMFARDTGEDPDPS